MKKFLSLGFAAMFCCSVNYIFSQSLGTALEDIRTDYNLVGMVAGVTCQGEPFETFYGGLSRIPTGQAVDEQTYFRVASISKTFTAAGLMRLYDQGAFELNDDISDALGYTVRNPLFPSTPITYRMLLSHRSSLQDGGGYSPFLNATVGTNSPPSISSVLLPGGTYYTSNIWRTSLPGSNFAYSNLNYGVIGTLIEALSGQRFDVFMNQEVLEPLGIAGSYNVSDIDDIENMAVLYRNSIAQIDNYMGVTPPPFGNPAYVPGTNGARFGPQGGLRTNLNGLLAFGNMLVNDGLHEGSTFLDSASVVLMLRREWQHNGSNGDNYFGLFNSWGLGIHRSLGQTGSATGDAVIPGELLYGHPGEAYGLISDLYFDPASKFVLAFMTNGYSTGGNYVSGLTTTFYRVEEEVFASIADSLWGACQNFDPSVPSDCTDAPLGLATEVLEEGVFLTWQAIEGSAGCRVNGQLITENGPIGNQNVDLAEPEASMLFVPASELVSGATYRWRVRCACTLSPIDATPWSPWQVFSNGSGIGPQGDTQQGFISDGQFEVYPNPSTGKVRIAGPSEVFLIEVFALSGQLVYSGASQGQGLQHEIQLEDLAKGTYVMRLNDNDFIETKLLLIE